MSFPAGHFSERPITGWHSLSSFLLICSYPKRDCFRRILQTLPSFTQKGFQERKNKNNIIRPVSFVPLLPPSDDTEPEARQGQQSSPLESQAVGIEDYMDSASFSKSSGRKLCKIKAWGSWPCLFHSAFTMLVTPLKGTGTNLALGIQFKAGWTPGSIVKVVWGDTVNFSGRVYSSSSSFHL